jgi:hypothetical protein
MSFEARRVARLFWILLIAQCSSLDGRGTNGNALAGSFTYACSNPETLYGPIQDFGCLNGPNYTVALPTAFAAGARFYAKYSSTLAYGGGQVVAAAPGVLLVDAQGLSGISSIRIIATRPTSATLLGLCADAYSSSYGPCGNDNPPRVDSVMHVQIRRVASLDVIRTVTNPYPYQGDDAGSFTDDGGTTRIFFPYSSGPYVNGNVLVIPRDADGNPLAGMLLCSWMSSSGVTITSNAPGFPPSTTGGALITLNNLQSATIHVTCGNLSKTFEVVGQSFPDAGFDAPSDGPLDAPSDGSLDAPNDGGQDG